MDDRCAAVRRRPEQGTRPEQTPHPFLRTPESLIGGAEGSAQLHASVSITRLLALHTRVTNKACLKQRSHSKHAQGRVYPPVSVCPRTELEPRIGDTAGPTSSIRTLPT